MLEMSGWGSNSRLLLMQHATLPLLFIGDLPPLMTFPKQGDHSAARESIQPDGVSLSTPCHPAVLASQVAWITGESQFSRHSQEVCEHFLFLVALLLFLAFQKGPLRFPSLLRYFKKIYSRRLTCFRAIHSIAELICETEPPTL